MAIRGRKPKPAGQAVHRGHRVHDWTDVPNVPFSGAPELPERRGNGRPWPERTRETWAAWSTMPHCVLWRPSDWAFALTAIELAGYMHDGEWKLAAEVRAWEKVMGTTMDARLGQRIRYVDPVAEPVGTSAVVANMVDYRDL
jgi:hypothetical protein